MMGNQQWGLFIFMFICLSPILSQGYESLTWRGKIVNQSTGAVVPNALIAVFSQVMLYEADDNGFFKIGLQSTDSVRVVALGYQSRTFRVKDIPENQDGWVLLKLFPVSYTLKGVTVKGYKGIFDPMFFPKKEDDPLQIDLHLPSYFGSKMSKIPANERLLMGKVSPLAAVASPISFGYSLFSKHEKSLKNLAIAKVQAKSWELSDRFADRATIAAISGFEGKALDDFIVYCNIHLKLSAFDNYASADAKIRNLLARYNDEPNQGSENK
jgi:hypothetical protein